MLGNQRTEGKAVPLKCPGADLPEADVDDVCAFVCLQGFRGLRGERVSYSGM